MISSTPLLAVLLWFIWGGTFIAVKVGLEAASPAMFGLLRVLAAGVVLAVVVLFLRPSCELRAFRSPTFLWTGALLGLTNVAGLIAFTHLAMVRAEAGFSAVVVYAQPFLVSLVAHYAFHEPLTTRKTLGLMAGWSGVVVVVSGHLFEGQVSLGTVALLLAAAISWTVGSLLFKSLPRDVPVWPVLLWQNAAGAVPLAALAWWEPVRVEWGATLAFSLLLAGVGAGVAGFGLQFLLLRRGAASAVGSWIFAVPVVSSGLSIAFLGEPVRPTLLLGILAVAAGIYLVNRPTRPVSSPPAATGAP